MKFHIFGQKINKILKNFKIGFDPKLFTENILEKYFEIKVNLIPIEFNFKKKKKKKKKIFSIK